jgi:hypothetical protein
MDQGQPRARPEDIAPEQPRDEATQRFMPICSTQKRSEIIEAALPRLESGETTDAIGASYGIPGSTIRSWLLSDERADKARCVFFAGELTAARDDIKVADTPLSLARAREDFRATSWLAERRLSHLYGPKQEITNITPPPILSITIAPQQLPEKDVTPDTPE